MTTQQIGRLSVKQLKLSKMAFKWNINPAGTNIYVDKDGNDSTGNGTSSNPYKSIAKATSKVRSKSVDEIPCAHLAKKPIDAGIITNAS